MSSHNHATDMPNNAYTGSLDGTHEGMVKIIPTPLYPQIVLALNLLCLEPPKFHWYIFVPNNQDTAFQAGRKLHAVDNVRNGNQTVWAFEAADFTLVYSKTLVAGLIIGSVHQGKGIKELEDLLKQIPMAVPRVDIRREPVFTCRVWVREAIRRMHDQGFINCLDVDALMTEMEACGNSAAQKLLRSRFTIANLSRAKSCQPVTYQPRPPHAH